MNMPTVGLKTQSIPARSVSTTAGVTPTSSKVLSKIKQFGKNPDAIPKLASEDYKKTIRDLDKIKSLNNVEKASLLSGLLGTGGAATAAAFKNKKYRNIGLGVAALSGITHGVASKKKSNIDYRMQQRHEAFNKGFKKQAAVFTGAHALADALTDGALTRVVPGMGHGSLALLDVAAMPALADIAKKTMRSGAARHLKSSLGYPMLPQEQFMTGVTSSVSGLRKGFSNLVDAIGRKLRLSDRAMKPVKYLADYPGRIAGAVVGEGGESIASKVAPIANITQQIDPLMTQRLISAIPEGLEGDAARKSLKAIGKTYTAGLDKIEKAFNNTESLKKIISVKPGNKERFLSDVKTMYDKNFHYTQVDKTTDKVVNLIKDMDKATAKAMNYYNENDKAFNLIGTILRKGSPAKPLSEAIKNQTAEKLVDSAIEGAETIKRVGKTTGLGLGFMGAGYLAGYGAEKARDKANSFNIKTDLRAKSNDPEGPLLKAL